MNAEALSIKKWVRLHHGGAVETKTCMVSAHVTVFTALTLGLLFLSVILSCILIGYHRIWENIKNLA